MSVIIQALRKSENESQNLNRAHEKRAGISVESDGNGEEENRRAKNIELHVKSLPFNFGTNPISESENQLAYGIMKSSTNEKDDPENHLNHYPQALQPQLEQ